MEPDLTDRVARLEQQLDQLLRELGEERTEIARRRRRETWTRIALVLALAVFYLLYFRGLAGL